MIYKNINKCSIQGNFVTGEVWIPETKVDIIQIELQSLLESNEEILPYSFYPIDSINAKPPTYFKDNDFFFPFQEIINTYGVPRYKEINPALFTIVSFPFLFGIMFGDLGHGFLLFLSATYLCLYKDKINNDESSILKPLLRVRYILVFMGFFSFYGGMMYNDFMAIPTSFFSSCYTTDPMTKVTTKIPGCVYPIGLDSKWYAATNELAFTNSFKMKWSVVIGVLQMTMGIILKGMNNLYFNNKIGFYFEFIPQLIFMTSIFGYMIVLIYIKWATNWIGREYMAPSIITTLMGIALKNGSVENKPLWGPILIEEAFNRYLLYVAILCVPIILFPRPLYTLLSRRKQSKKVQSELEELLISKSDDKDKEMGKGIEEHHESFSDIFVEQCIATIEFVLGTISNTASYLRLWALSLAHAQLSHVFFDKSLMEFARGGSIVFVTIGYFVFANATVGVLMGMDLMESFLHTLRLHWVEFQSKFYAADGYKYTPFCFKTLIEQE